MIFWTLTTLFILDQILTLWVYFVGGMHLKHLRDEGKLTRTMKVFGYAGLVKGLLIDFLVQLFIGTILFLEVPREWTLSGRLWRLSNGAPSWRQKLAYKLRVSLLDSIDPKGYHSG